MATLLDTSALVVFLRSRRPTPRHERTARLVGEEMRAGLALVAAVSATELMVGARGAAEERRLGLLLDRIPVVQADREIALLSGSLGAYLRRRGALLPQADLTIAATAISLELPLLTCDADFRRGRQTAMEDVPGEEGSAPAREAWRSLLLHPASVV